MRILQAQMLQWAVDTFGPVALNPHERAARMIEEAIELAQAAGLDADIMTRILARVYERPPGDLAQEVGQLAFTLATLAENVGIDAQAECNREFYRVLALPKSVFQRKFAEKIEAGTTKL